VTVVTATMNLLMPYDAVTSKGSFSRRIAITHREVVQLLLAHEASTNILDAKGSSPLHLAAWTGNVDIVRLLLCHGPSVPNVNLTVSIISCIKYRGRDMLICGWGMLTRNSRKSRV
jgi:ankyrin repeat protein